MSFPVNPSGARVLHQIKAAIRMVLATESAAAGVLVIGGDPEHSATSKVRLVMRAHVSSSH